MKSVRRAARSMGGSLPAAAAGVDSGNRCPPGGNPPPLQTRDVHPVGPRARNPPPAEQSSRSGVECRKKALSRRRFLTVAGTATGAVVVSQLPFAKARTAPPRFTGYPFTLGVASGDPTPDGVVLWTRLAPAPLAGNGGMPDKDYPGRSGRSPRTRASRTSSPAARSSPRTADAHSVHAEPRGPRAGLEYFYRFKANGEISPTGRTKTAPRGHGQPRWRSRSRPASSTSTATSRPTSTWPQEDLDLVIHLGDYIYEYDSNSYTATGGNVRGELQPRDRQPRRLPRAPRAVQDRPGPAGRARRVRVAGHLRRPRGRQQLGRRHRPRRACRWTSSSRRRGPRSGPTGSTCRCARPQRPTGTASRSTGARRTATWRRSTCWTRASSAPTRRAATASSAGCDDRSNPARTITGAAAGAVALRRAAAVAGQVADPRPAGLHGPAATHATARARPTTWTPGTATRSPATSCWTSSTRARSPNPIVITGDVHAELGRRPAARLPRPGRRRSSARSSSAPRSRPPATAATRRTPARLTENPWIKFNNQQRGYVRVALDQQLCRADYRVVPYVKRPGAPISTRKSFVVEAGNPGLKDA